MNSADVLGPEGPFAREVPGFAPRIVQQHMAAAVEHAIAGHETLIAEAGTGTGKTFAYLVPALLSGRRVIVSTGTKALQDQLYHRDLPRVRGVLGARVAASLLKGRANYLCRYRLDQAWNDDRRIERTRMTALASIRAWAAHTGDGDRASLPSVPEDSPLWPQVTSTVENCLGSDCPFYEDCFVVKARRAAQQADLVVVNHHLLFADLAMKQEGFGEILPGAHAFVLDEAHQIPEVAGQFFSVGVTARQIEELAADALAECGGATGALALLQPVLEPLLPALRRVRLAMDGQPPRGALRQLEAAAGFAGELEALRTAVADLADVLSSQRDRSPGLAGVHERAARFLARLDAFGGRAGDGRVRWYETTPRGFALRETPLDLAGPLREMRERTGAAWIFTSATLSVTGRFDHYARQLGLDDPHTLALDSPFDYANQALAYLPPGLPDPGSPDYAGCVVEAVLPVIEAAGGRTFFLFTAHRALQATARLLAGRCAFPLFVQGTAPRHRLLEDFRASGNGVLLGAASFWEGVDVVGEALSCVIIDKLPFAAPDDPVLMARLDALRDAGGNPFTDWQIPAAVIALKQGAGRLIRGTGDRGVLVLCDPRLTRRGYGRLFLASLPPMPRTVVLADVERFLGSGATDADRP
jgi:ATP-dependent DNA helicase DinG